MSKVTAEFRMSALRRGLLVKSAKGSSSEQVAFAASIELANLGFVVPPAELTAVSAKTLTDTIEQARKIMGADRDMTPIYPGFPKQVQELSTMTLLVEQILHYWSGGALLPDYPSIVREGLPVEDMLRNARSLKVVNAAAAAREMVAELVASPIAMSVDDKTLLLSALELQKPSVEMIVDTVKRSRNGENVQTFLSSVSAVTGGPGRDELALAVIPVAANSDVLLRMMLTLFSVGAPMKKGEVLGSEEMHSSSAELVRIQNYNLAVTTLADRHSRAVRMLNIPRPVRRLVLAKLADLSDGFRADSLVGRQDLWRKVMTAIHPYDFKMSEASKRAADIIHSNVEYKTLNSLVEAAMQDRDVVTAITLLAENQPGNLLRRVVALLRLVKSDKEAKKLAKAVRRVGPNAALTTLISAYNGVIAANDGATRVTRVAGLKNTMVTRAAVEKVQEEHIALLLKALKKAMREALAKKAAPAGPVAVTSSNPVPLVRRDAATADRQMDRGAEFGVAGEGDTLRIFSHWKNNQRNSGYMDIGLVFLDDKFETLGVITFNSWASHRDIGTYSGDKHVQVGHSAAEYFDVELKKLRKKYPTAIYAAMTIQSYNGWPTSKVDIIAGAMLRSKPNSGEVFDPRSITTAFKPTTDSTQSVPFAIDLRTGKMIWVDSSNGSDAAGVSSTSDNSIGSIIYDELERPRLTLGELATLWAKAHNVETVKEPVNQKQLMSLL